VARRIESLLIPGPAGQLEALLEEPETPPVHACLVSHPHPLYAGTMHNKVVYRIARGFRRAGAVVLRYNFRGVGKSDGVYDHGIGEIEDARAALHFLRERYPALPYSIAGFSFGSRVSLQLGCTLDPVRIVAVGFPVSRGRFEYLANCTVPKYFVQGTNDQYGSVEDLTAMFETIPGPKELQFVESNDHFFEGGLEGLEEAIFEIAGASMLKTT
jgi:uncharacterized protein